MANTKFDAVKGALQNNGASLFAAYLDANKAIRNIYYFTDETLYDILGRLNVTYDAFLESSLYNNIIAQHVLPNQQQKFKIIGNSIDDIPFTYVTKIDGITLYELEGILLTKEQLAEIQKLSDMLKYCVKDYDSTIFYGDANCSVENDAFGYGIFVVFDKKYRADKIFERAANKVLDLYRSKRLTQKGLYQLSNVVELYSDSYERFVDMIIKERKYIQKASSGKPPIKLVTAEDWGEAIIEFVDLVNKFQQVLEENIKLYTSATYLQKECNSLKVDECGYPCQVKNPLVGKKSCIYK